MSVVLGAVCLLMAGLASNPVGAQSRSGSLRVTVERAPVAPDGDVAGAATDLLVVFADTDPAVPGVAMRAGGTIRITLPEEFRNNGSLPVASTGSSPACAPPKVEECSTSVITQGWPQSPVLPFPSTTWEAATNTIVVTTNADWEPTVGRPGPKLVHLMLFGFTNPERPGSYRLGVEIQPDPNSSRTLRGNGRAKINRQSSPAISPNSLVNGAPPPPFPNPLFQSVLPGDTSDTMTFYMWDRAGEPFEEVDFAPGSATTRPLRDGSGRRIGSVRVKPPRGARNWSLESRGPSMVVDAFITGLPTGRLMANLKTDPDASGPYRLRFNLQGGNTIEHIITSEYRSTSPVMWEFDDETMVGTSSLLRTEDGLHGDLTATGLTPGDAVTMWIAFFTNPEACSATPCPRPGDVGNPATGADLYWVDGAVVDADGQVTFGGTVRVGQVEGSLKDEVGLVPGVRLSDPFGSEVAMALHSHGPALEGRALREQLTTFLGGCEVLTGVRGFAQSFDDLPDEVGECTTFQKSIHLVPDRRP